MTPHNTPIVSNCPCQNRLDNSISKIEQRSLTGRYWRICHQRRHWLWICRN